MAEDAIMLDQAMDIDDHVTSIPSTGGTTAPASRNPLRTRRSPDNSNEKRGNRDPLKHRPGAKVQKSSSNPNTNRHNGSGHADQNSEITYRAWKVARYRKRCIKRAIASGTWEVPAISNLEEIVGRSAVDQHEPQKLQRLNAHIVTQALHEPLPGMAFDAAAPPTFTDADMLDLVRALEAYQMNLAAKGRVRLASEAGSLVRSFARDVLYIVLMRPEKLNHKITSGGFWEQVGWDLQRAKKVRWLAQRVIKMLDFKMVRTCPLFSFGMSFPEQVDVVLAALDSPGKHPVIDEALAKAEEDIPAFIATQPSTLRALVGHFEAARARYLANLNTSLDQDNQSNLVANKPAQGFEMLPTISYQYDSDDEDIGGIRHGAEYGGIEDNAQVEEGVLSGHRRWFLYRIDRWMALKNGEPQGGVDTDMLSALNLV